MSLPLAVPADGQHAIVDFLEAAYTDRGVDATAQTDLPDDWTPDSGLIVQVALDGTPVGMYPVYERSTIRVVVWGPDPDPVKDLARLSQGLLLRHPGGNGIRNIGRGVGLQLDKDPASGALLGWFTVLVALKFTALA